REGITGPEISIPVVAAAPALFAMDGGYAIAVHADNITLVDNATPAHAGDVIVVYATGLGKASDNPDNGELPGAPSQIANLATLQVTLGGVLLDASRILYAGLTPGSAGLYQINLIVPNATGADPEIRVTVAGVSSASGLRLAIR